MNRVVCGLLVAFAALGAGRAAEPDDDAKFLRALRKTTDAAQKLDVSRMFGQIMRKGADMSMGDGWFQPSETRFTWNWLSARAGKKDRISSKDFNGPTELFARLDRDRDGFITSADLDWADNTTYARQYGFARQWLARQSRDGKLTKEQWDALFDQLSQGKGYLNADDARALLNPPAPPSGGFQPGPFDRMPTKAVLLQGLLNGEIGSMFEGPKLGQFGPDFTLPTQDGKKRITLSDYRNKKPVVLIFGSFT